jgi:hypothetical protein
MSTEITTSPRLRRTEGRSIGSRRLLPLAARDRGRADRVPRAPRRGSGWLFAAWVFACAACYFTFMLGSRIETALKEWLGL